MQSEHVLNPLQRAGSFVGKAVGYADVGALVGELVGALVGAVGTSVGAVVLFALIGVDLQSNGWRAS
jgi:hypothetical protein